METNDVASGRGGAGLTLSFTTVPHEQGSERVTARYHPSACKSGLCNTPCEGCSQGCGTQGERPIDWLGTGFQGLC